MGEYTLDKRHARGIFSENLVAAYLAGQNKEIFLPTSPRSRCDLIYLDPHPVRVQIKTASMSTAGGNTYEQCRLIKRANPSRVGYSSDEVDELWVVGTHLWRFPVAEIAGRTSLCLSAPEKRPHREAHSYCPEERIVLHGTSEKPFRSWLGASL